MKLQLAQDLYYPPLEPVNSRAWTLEERLLSRRLLLLTELGPLWQCQTSEYFLNDSGALSPFVTAGFQRLLQRSSAHDEVANDALDIADGATRNACMIWKRIIEDYVDRSLTHPEDRLIAIAGVAEEMQALYPADLGTYVAGMWSTCLAHQLYWEVLANGQRGEPYVHTPSGLAPSWSWAAHDSAVIWRQRQPGEESQTCVSILDIQYSLTDQTLPFQGTTYGHLRLRAAVAEARLYAHHNCPVQDDCEGRIIGEDGRMVLAMARLDTKEFVGAAWVPVTCMLLLIWDADSKSSPFDGSVGLMASRNEDATYRRIGSFRGSASEDFLDWFDEKEMVLV